MMSVSSVVQRYFYEPSFVQKYLYRQFHDIGCSAVRTR